MSDTPISDFVKNIWGDVTGAVSSGVNTAVTAVEGLSKEWTDKVAQLKKAGSDFTNTYNNMLSLQSTVAKSPQLQSEYNDLMSRGSTLKNTISTLLNGIQSIYNSITGSSSTAGLSSLGILPAIPIWLSVAAIAGAITLLTKWITDANVIADKARIMEAANATLNTQVAAAKAAGASPAEVNTLVQKITDQTNLAMNNAGRSTLDQAKDLLTTATKFVAVGVIAYYGVPYLFKLLSGGKK